MDIGFIGLGNMGFHMARRLLAAGHSVIALDTRKDVLDRMVALGASPAGSPKEVADRAETVMASLPTPDIVLQVATGPGGIIEGQRVRRFVDLSTTGSSMARRIFDLLKARAIVQVDAPVSGGVSGAEKGTLAVMASGPRAEVEAVEPALAVIGKVFHIGEQPGAGQTMKLANNFLSATAMAATSEAMVMGVKAGLDPRVMLDVINSGSGRNTATETKFPKNVLPGTFDLGFTNGLMAAWRSPRPRRSACRWRWRKRSCASCGAPATRSAPTRISPPSCSRSSGAWASRCGRRRNEVRAKKE
jgi:hypothetical protein